MKKVYLFSFTAIMSTTKIKILAKCKDNANNKFKYQREERIQISSANGMSRHVVSEVAVGACGVIGPARSYWRGSGHKNFVGGGEGRWGSHFLLAGFLGYGDMRPGE